MRFLPLAFAVLLPSLLTLGCEVPGVCLGKIEFPGKTTPTRYTCTDASYSHLSTCKSVNVADSVQTREWVENKTCPELGYSTACSGGQFYAGPTCDTGAGNTWNTPGNRVAGGSEGGGGGGGGTSGGPICNGSKTFTGLGLSCYTATKTATLACAKLSGKPYNVVCNWRSCVWEGSECTTSNPNCETAYCGGGVCSVSVSGDPLCH